MNNRSKGFLTALAFSSLVAVGTLVIFVAAGPMYNPSLFVHADNQVFNIDASRKPTIEAGNGSLAIGDYSNFTYTNASNEEGYHVVLGAGGVMRKTEATNGLSGLTVAFTGSIKVETDWTDSFAGDHYVLYPSSGDALNVRGNYWKITALESSKIESVTLSYNCDVAEAVPDSSASTVTGMPTTGKFAWLEESDGDILFAFNGEMYGYIAASDLTIRENRFSGNFQFIIDAEKVEYTSPSTFVAYFNISSFYAHKEATINFYPHLYVRNSQWTGSTTDLRTWQDGEEHGNSVIIDSSPTMDDGNKTIALTCMNWAESTGRFYMPHLTMSTTTKHFSIDDESKSGGSLFSETSVSYTSNTTTIQLITSDRSMQLDPEMFVLCDRSETTATNAIVASDATYEEYAGDKYKVSITFDLTLFNKYYSGSELNIWCHLLIHGDSVTTATTWDGSESGDLKLNNTAKSADENWAHQYWFRIGNIGYNYWNSYSMLIIQLKPES